MAGKVGIGRIRPRRTWWVVGLVIAVVLVVLVRWERPRDLDGSGTLMRYGFGCLGIRLDDHTPAKYEPVMLPIADWPGDLSAYDSDGHQLVDASGVVVLREGDRIAIHARVEHLVGDPSPCYYTQVMTVLSYEVLATAAP
jgi:hypothetical protein